MKAAASGQQPENQAFPAFLENLWCLKIVAHHSGRENMRGTIFCFRR